MSEKSAFRFQPEKPDETSRQSDDATSKIQREVENARSSDKGERVADRVEGKDNPVQALMASLARIDELLSRLPAEERVNFFNNQKDFAEMQGNKNKDNVMTNQMLIACINPDEDARVRNSVRSAILGAQGMA